MRDDPEEGIQVTRIYTLCPATTEGVPGNDWRQSTRWLVLDVTDQDPLVVAGPLKKTEAHYQMLLLRAYKPEGV